MGNTTAISWTDSTWNPLRGCTRVSPGCQHCYAETVAARFSGPGLPYEDLARKVNGHAQWTGKLMFVEKALTLPLQWQEPRRIFANSMSDLFHPDVPVEFIARVWAVMALAPRHTYQILTKRPERMAEVLQRPDFYRLVLDAADLEFRAARPKLGGVPISDPTKFPYCHVWLGTSIESDEHVGRADILREIPARVRFISAEPLLGPLPSLDLTGIHWVIVGGESGPAHRPMDHAWARGIRDRCRPKLVAYFFKQSSGLKSGAGPALIEEDGSYWAWRQYPGQFTPPTMIIPPDHR